MTRSKPSNNYLKNKNKENRTLHALLGKSKKHYKKKTFCNEKNVMDNKIVWKPIKPSISDLLIARERIHLTKNDKFVKTTSILAIRKGKKTDKLLFQSFY